MKDTQGGEEERVVVPETFETQAAGKPITEVCERY
jgi:hypothetical protein